MVKGIAVAALLLALTGCTTTKGSFCDVSSPIRLSASAVDALSDAEAKALLTHNRKGAALCHWKP
jgi:hypothetical protein